MNQRLFRKRRLGVAVLAGVTALGAATIVGEGVAAAATPTVLATVATPVTSVLSTAAATAGSNLTLTVTGSAVTGDEIVLSMACNSAVQFAVNNAAPASGWAATVGTASTCSGTTKNEYILTATSPAANSIVVAPAYVTSGAATGAIALSGTYVGAGANAGVSSFTVPSDATVVGVTVVPQTPITAVPLLAKNSAIGNVTLISPTVGAIANGNFVCVTLSGSNTFDSFSAQPTVNQTNGAATSSGGTLVTAGSAVVQTAAGVASLQGNTVSFQVTGTAATSAPTFVLSNLHADGVTAGPVTATVGTSASTNCSGPTVLGSGVIYAVGSTPGPISGQNADNTTAAEFDAAFVTATPSGSSISYTCSNNGNAVVATSAQPYDSLSASYLEGELQTGVLITPPTSLSAATTAALQYAGVQRVYVVGGNLAVSPAVIAAIQALPAYTCGGVAKTGAPIQVYSGISGQTADDTAVAIANYITSTPQSLPSIAAAYSTAATYNQTTGNASAAAPTTSGSTAILVSDTDYRDAAAAAGIAWAYHVPVILTTPTALSATASAELVKLGVNQVIAIGGQLALTPAVVTSVQALTVGGAPISVLRIAGQDYTQTAADLALFEGTVLHWANSTVYVAQGQGWSDSLGAAALSGKNSGALLLTLGPVAGVGQYTDAALKTAGTSPSGLGGGVTTSIQVLGGSLAVTAAQTTEMQNSLLAG